MQPDLLRIGTRGSPLALAQAEEVKRRLIAAHGFAEASIAIVTFKTSGDRIQDRSLSEAGGKGLFTKEIEEALLAHEVDLAVHSAKDMPTVLPDGLVIPGYLPREDVRDAFLSPRHAGLAALPQGAVLGTSSLRRKAMALRRRPDLRVVEFRGNVQTRLRKLAEGVAEATLLAMAGLKRLGLDELTANPIGTEEFLPAVGQGAIAIEIRGDDAATGARLAPILDHATGVALAAERAFLGALDGSCRTPIGGHARFVHGRLNFRGLIVSPDGRQAHETTREGSEADAAALGRDAGEELRRRGGPHFFDA